MNGTPEDRNEPNNLEFSILNCIDLEKLEFTSHQIQQCPGWNLIRPKTVLTGCG